MKENYVYPAILNNTDDEMYEVTVPNFPDLVTCVYKKENYIEAIQEWLSLVIDDYEKIGKTLPKPLLANEIKVCDRQILIYINLWMPYHYSKMKVEYVKKTLTIPSWLDILAKEKNVNFSALLVEALKKELYIK